MALLYTFGSTLSSVTFVLLLLLLLLLFLVPGKVTPLQSRPWPLYPKAFL